VRSTTIQVFILLQNRKYLIFPSFSLLALFKKFQNLPGSSVSVNDVKTNELDLRVESRMEMRFSMEAKTFFFSTKASQFHLEERRVF
jgi:hypothetical protein